MENSTIFTGHKSKTISGTTLEFAFTDNLGHWDNNGGKNYKITSPGVYRVHDITMDFFKYR